MSRGDCGSLKLVPPAPLFSPQTLQLPTHRLYKHLQPPLRQPCHHAHCNPNRSLLLPRPSCKHTLLRQSLLHRRPTQTTSPSPSHASPITLSEPRTALPQSPTQCAPSSRSFSSSSRSSPSPPPRTRSLTTRPSTSPRPSSRSTPSLSQAARPTRSTTPPAPSPPLPCPPPPTLSLPTAPRPTPLAPEPPLPPRLRPPPPTSSPVLLLASPSTARLSPCSPLALDSSLYDRSARNKSSLRLPPASRIIDWCLSMIPTPTLSGSAGPASSALACSVHYVSRGSFTFTRFSGSPFTPSPPTRRLYTFELSNSGYLLCNSSLYDIQRTMPDFLYPPSFSCV